MNGEAQTVEDNVSEKNHPRSKKYTLTCGTGPADSTTLSPVSGSCTGCRSGGCRDWGNWGRGGDSGSRDCRRGRRWSRAAGDKRAQAKPVKCVGLMLGDGVADALCENCLDVGTKRRARVARLGIVGGVGDGCLTDAEDVRPLLNFLPEVLGVERCVSINIRSVSVSV